MARGGELAAEVGARSADHIEYLSQAGVEAMAQAGVTAVLLPGAYYSLRADQPPPVDALRAADVPLALATDANPGSSPITHVGVVMNMACLVFGLTPEEAIRGFTVAASRVLGVEKDRGTVAPGMRADLAIWGVEDLTQLSYWVGESPLVTRVKDGRPLNRRPVGG